MTGTVPFNTGQTDYWRRPSNEQVRLSTKGIHGAGGKFLTERQTIRQLETPSGLIGAAYGATGYALKTDNVPLMRKILHQHDLFARIGELRWAAELTSICECGALLVGGVGHTCRLSPVDVPPGTDDW